MAGKTFLSAFLTFVILFVVILVFDGPEESEKEFLAEYIIMLIAYGGFIIMVSSFVGLLVLNLLLGRVLKNKQQKDLHYFIWSAVCSLVPIFFFALSDYTNGGNFGDKSKFTSILGEYYGAFLMAFIAVIINRKIVWNNFKEKKGDPLNTTSSL